jgi:hypothetical protein
MGIDGPGIRRFITEEMSYSELISLASDLDVNLDDLPGETKSDKARDLFAFMMRHNRLHELEEYLVRNKPQFMAPKRSPEPRARLPRIDELDNLIIDMSQVRQGLREVQTEGATSSQVAQRIPDLLRLTTRAIARGEELTARVVLPPSELTDVHLVPMHLLDRLEEYRSDENLASLLAGTFAGALLGVLGNWLGDAPLSIMPSSILLSILLLLLAIGSSVWWRRLRCRGRAVRGQMLSPGRPQ